MNLKKLKFIKSGFSIYGRAYCRVFNVYEFQVSKTETVVNLSLTL